MPRLTTSSILVIDDYGFFRCEGVKNFVMDLEISQAFASYSISMDTPFSSRLPSLQF